MSVSWSLVIFKSEYAKKLLVFEMCLFLWQLRTETLGVNENV